MVEIVVRRGAHFAAVTCFYATALFIMAGSVTLAGTASGRQVKNVEIR